MRGDPLGRCTLGWRLSINEVQCCVSLLEHRGLDFMKQHILNQMHVVVPSRKQWTMARNAAGKYGKDKSGVSLRVKMSCSTCLLISKLRNIVDPNTAFGSMCRWEKLNDIWKQLFSPFSTTLFAGKYRMLLIVLRFYCNLIKMMILN